MILKFELVTPENTEIKMQNFPIFLQYCNITNYLLRL